MMDGLWMAAWSKGCEINEQGQTIPDGPRGIRVRRTDSRRAGDVPARGQIRGQDDSRAARAEKAEVEGGTDECLTLRQGRGYVKGGWYTH